jgi:hypothetical protein
MSLLGSAVIFIGGAGARFRLLDVLSARLCHRKTNSASDRAAPAPHTPVGRWGLLFFIFLVFFFNNFSYT